MWKRNMRRWVGVGLVAVGALGVAVSSAAVTTSTFTPPDPGPPFVPSGDWTDASKWDTANFPNNGQPGAGDTYNAIINFGLVHLDADITIETLTLTDDARIRDASSNRGKTLTLNGPFAFIEGSVAGKFTINANAGVNFTGNEIKRLSASFNPTSGEVFNTTVNATGISTWTGGVVVGGSVSGISSMFNNLAGSTFTATAAGKDFSAQFNNDADLILDPGADQTIEFDWLVNHGTTTIKSGTLSLQRLFAVPTVSNGSFDVQAGTTLKMDGHNLGAPGSITGDGDVILTSSTKILGTYNLGGTTTLEGATTFGSTARTAGLVIDASSSAGEQLGSSLDVSGASVWTAGKIAGNLTINANGGMSFESTDRASLQGDVVLNLGGNSTWAGDPVITLEDNAQLNVLPGGTFTIDGSRTFTSPFDPRGTFSNAGTLHKTGTGFLSFKVPVFNTGLVVVDAGAFILFADGGGAAGPAGLTQTAGELRLDGGTLSGVRNMLGGKITGFGEVSSTLDLVAGILAPGHDGQAGPSVGTLHINFLELMAGATTQIDLAGTADTEFDRVINDRNPVFADPGEHTLGGDLTLRFAAGFESQVLMADTFAIFEATAEILGTFANIAPGQRLATADGFGSFVVNYGAQSAFGDNKVVLSDYEEIPEPAAALALLALLGAGTRRRSR